MIIGIVDLWGVLLYLTLSCIFDVMDCKYTMQELLIKQALKSAVDEFIVKITEPLSATIHTARKFKNK